MKKNSSPFFLGNPFSVDLRSLAIFRIGLGFLIALDTFHKLFIANTFYTDFGVFPRAYWIENYMVPMKFSIHLASGDLWFQLLLLGAQLLCALVFMVGLRTRTAGGVLLFLICSLQSRNNLILSASDEIMRLMLIWSFFVPVHARFAVQPVRREGETVASPGTAIVLLQLFSMYIFTAFLKWHPVWTEEYSAVYYAINIDLFAKAPALWLRPYYRFTQLITVSTLVWEFVGPVLAVVFTGWVRFFSAMIFILFHLSLAACLHLGLFPWVAILYWLVYFPPEFWAWKPAARLSDRLEGISSWLAKKLPAAPMAKPASRRVRVCAQIFASLLFALVTWNNLASIKAIGMPDFARNAVRFLYVDQTWDMFAPYPMKNDGWFVIEGEFQNGSKWDIWNQGPISYEKPQYPADAYPSSEWRKFMLHVWDDGSQRILLPFARHLCRRYSLANGEAADIALIKIHFVKETTPAPGQPFAVTQAVNLWSHDCFAP